MRIIRKEIVIDAPIEKVWAHITDPAKIAGWLMPNDFQSVVGSSFSMDCGEEGTISCVVKEIVPPVKLVYSFTTEKIQIQTLVTITLASESGGTRVTLVHSGWSALPPSDQGMADEFEEGWAGKLLVLKNQITSN